MLMLMSNIFKIVNRIFSFPSISAKRALLATCDGGDDSCLPEQDSGGGGPGHHLQRPQGLRPFGIVPEGRLKVLKAISNTLVTTFNALKLFGFSFSFKACETGNVTKVRRTN